MEKFSDTISIASNIIKVEIANIDQSIHYIPRLNLCSQNIGEVSAQIKIKGLKDKKRIKS